MQFLRVEKRLIELWSKPRIDQQSWEGDWAKALEEARASGKPWLKVKTWGSYEVDYELRDEWLVKLNLYASLLGVSVTSVCAGHPHGVSGLGIMFAGQATGPALAMYCDSYETACGLAHSLAIPHTYVSLAIQRPVKYRYYRIFVSAAFKHSGKNQDRLASWWEEILASLKP